MSTDAVDPDAKLEQEIRAECQKAARQTLQAEKAATEDSDRAKSGQRERIVLAERRSRRVVRTLTELQDQTNVGLTSVGETLARELLWVQLWLSIRLMLLTVTVLAGIPLLFLLAPSLGTATIVGFRLPWVLLGLALYPFFVAVAWFYNRSADRIERAFVAWVRN
jgi:plasmid stabilization system protein ParE